MALICANTSGSTINPRAAFTSSFVRFGLKTSISTAFVETVFSTCIVLRPAKYFATSAGLPTVAERHIRWKSPASSTIRANATASCAPRLEFANSCTSSIITCFTDFKCSRMRAPVIIACIVSGVVMSTSGGSKACRLRAYLLVSPCRTSMVMPSFSPQRSNRKSISRFNARNGVM